MRVQLQDRLSDGHDDTGIVDKSWIVGLQRALSTGLEVLQYKRAPTGIEVWMLAKRRATL